MQTKKHFKVLADVVALAVWTNCNIEMSFDVDDVGLGVNLNFVLPTSFFLTSTSANVDHVEQEGLGIGDKG